MYQQSSDVSFLFAKNLKIKYVTCFQLQAASAVAFLRLHNSPVFRWRRSGDFLVITKLFGNLELKMTLWRAL